MEEDERGRVLIKELIETVIKVSEISDYRSSVKKEYCNLARSWLKLLTPMFEEIRDSKEKLNQNSVRELPKLKEAIILALELLQFGSGWSTIYMAELKQKLAELYSVKDPQAIFVFNFRTHFGGGKSTRFGLIYDSVENAKKYEPKYRLIRATPDMAITFLDIGEFYCKSSGRTRR